MLREINRAQTEINVAHWKKHATFTEHDKMNTAPFKTDWQVMNYKIYLKMEMNGNDRERIAQGINAIVTELKGGKFSETTAHWN